MTQMLAASRLRTTDRPTPRLGFLGVGWIGLQRLEALAASGAGTAAAIADTDAGRAAAAHSRATHAALATSVDELLDMPLDGVVIATPSALHAPQSIAALERGLAVFCQKPLATDASRTGAVLAAARAADRLLGIDLSYRYTRAAEAVRQAVRDGVAGDVFAVELVFHNAWGPDRGWARDPLLAGGGCVLDLGTHLVDLALWTLDFPHVHAVHSHLFSEGRRIRGGGAVCEDHALASIELANGAVIRLTCSWESSTGRDAIIVASFHGTRSTVALNNVNGSFHDFTAVVHEGPSTRTLVEPPDDWGGRALVEWSRRLSRDPAYDPAVETIAEVALTLDRVLQR
jgi:predicted dehydrogenase